MERVSLLVGAGAQGLRWAKEHPHHVSVDLDMGLIKSSTGPLVIGDAMRLPFSDDSISSIKADFLLNPVCIQKPPLKEVSEHPDRLYGRAVPDNVRSWYQKLDRPFNIHEGDLKTIRHLCRKTALDEMWRVLKPTGTLTILDRKQVRDWVVQQTNTLVPPPPLRDVQEMDITYHDEERSISLRNIRTKPGWNGPVRKISIRKPE